MGGQSNPGSQPSALLSHGLGEELLYLRTDDAALRVRHPRVRGNPGVAGCGEGRLILEANQDAVHKIKIFVWASEYPLLPDFIRILSSINLFWMPVTKYKIFFCHPYSNSIPPRSSDAFFFAPRLIFFQFLLLLCSQFINAWCFVLSWLTGSFLPVRGTIFWRKVTGLEFASLRISPLIHQRHSLRSYQHQSNQQPSFHVVLLVLLVFIVAQIPDIAHG